MAAPAVQSRLSHASALLNAGYVSEVVKQRLAAIGVENFYSAHSLCAGLVTEAAKAGVPSWKIRHQTGQKSEARLARYIRDDRLFGGDAATAVLGRR